MAKTVGEMTYEELKETLGELIEAKLTEMFGEPDDDLELRAELRERLERQRAEVARGVRGQSIAALAEQLVLA